MIRINLAPPDGRARRGQRPGLRLSLPDVNLGIVFGVVWLLGLLATGAWWWQVTTAEAELASRAEQAKSNLAQLKQRVGQAGKVREQVTELRKRVDAIHELARDQARPVVLFDTLADAVPRELWLTGVEERETQLRIMGAAFSTTAVADFMANLRATGRFKDVDIILSRQDLTKTPRQVTFEVTCRFEKS